jgi:RNA polymerase sigma-70 factor (ECF subfamily)
MAGEKCGLLSAFYRRILYDWPNRQNHIDVFLSAFVLMVKDEQSKTIENEGKERLPSENELIRRSSKGDSAAFEELLTRKRHRIFWVAFQMVGNEEDALDIVQQVFIKLWKVIGRFNFGFKLDRWLYRITVNASIDFYRKEKRIRQKEMEVATAPAVKERPPQERAMAIREIQEIYTDLAGMLSPRQRAVFTLREIEGLSVKEVAKVMRCRVSTVRNHMSQAREKLNRGLRSKYPGAKF